MRDTLKLLRIPFSFLLLPIFLLALSQAPGIDWLRTLAVFAILHLLVYPASNGYNSYVDKDTGPIGGLKDPPPPTRWLFWITLAMDILAVLGSLWVGWPFTLGLLGYVLASRAYSSDAIRLKKYPWAGFLTIFCFQGAWTLLTVLLGVVPAPLHTAIWQPRLLGLALAASCLVGGVYPLTQIYQHDSDAERGDRSLSALLGYRGTFAFAAGVIALGQVLLALCLPPHHFWLLQLSLLPVAIYFLIWARAVWHNPAKADFTGTMRMNWLAASCLNLCFAGLCLLNLPGRPL
ncbi:MAG TPA: UbiA family prenyltransferase [Candidatus Obscuribacterales bacterium]